MEREQRRQVCALSTDAAKYDLPIFRLAQIDDDDRSCAVPSRPSQVSALLDSHPLDLNSSISLSSSIDAAGISSLALASTWSRCNLTCGCSPENPIV